jgi:two-component system chemotaxis response regulator CheV
MAEKLEVLQVGQNKMELVDFRIFDGEDVKIYGINVAKVIEIIKMKDIITTPNSPEYIAGMITVREFVIPVVNLPVWFKINDEKLNKQDFKIIIAEFNKRKVGFIVHDAIRIRRVSWENIQSAQLESINNGNNSFVTGIIHIENDQLLLLQNKGLINPNIEVGRVQSREKIDENTIKEYIRKIGLDIQ